MAHGDARAGKWRGNWRMAWVASTLQTTSEHGVSSITTADAHNSAASSRLNWRPRRFKRTCPFRRKTKSGFCACAITFQLEPTYLPNASTRCSENEVGNNSSPFYRFLRIKKKRSNSTYLMMVANNLLLGWRIFLVRTPKNDHIRYKCSSSYLYFQKYLRLQRFSMRSGLT
jgi:hypothetical protein